MSTERTSLFDNGLIWFGAGLSIAEIMTGTCYAPLGFAEGLAAIILGHIIGCVMLFAAGLIGGLSRKSSMESVKMSFGQKGSLLFVCLNIIQLFGWTGIMIYDGASAAGGIWNTGRWFWCVVIGVLITMWILIGIRNLGRINTVAMTALFILTVFLCFAIFGNGAGSAETSGEIMTFGAAVELSVAMPLSWLPLISDYTREAASPVRATAVSALVYGVVSCWMYFIGMGSAILTGESDIALIIVKAGLGAAGLVIVVFSTVTTTFLDAYSAGVSAESLPGRVSGKWAAVAVAVLGMICAVFFPIEDITDFLYFIGSVFAPMIAVQIADYFILKKDYSTKEVKVSGLLIWLVGFIIYRLLMNVDMAVGNTLPDMAITILICLAVRRLFPSEKNTRQTAV